MSVLSCQSEAGVKATDKNENKNSTDKVTRNKNETRAMDKQCNSRRFLRKMDRTVHGDGRRSVQSGARESIAV